MKKMNKIFIILIVAIVLIGIAWYFINKKIQNNKIVEIQPEEEISEEQERQTLVSLYFRNKLSKEIEPEGRLIDVKELVKDPYNTLLKLLIEGPKNENLEKIIPEGTTINSTKLENDMLIIDLSGEFIQNNEQGGEAEINIIKSIVNTMTELTEVNSVKILINGEENKAFLDNEINFEEAFIRQE